MFLFLVLTNVKLLFDYQHDKLEQSKVTCLDSIGSLVHARQRSIAISLEAFQLLKHVLLPQL